jgi:hypothetical protein
MFYMGYTPTALYVGLRDHFFNFPHFYFI